MKDFWNIFADLPREVRAQLSLEPGTLEDPYYCYPVNARPIGFEGCILYCFIEGYEDMVFASNPENYGDSGQVYPLARNFEEFLRLVLACGGVNPAEQAVWMTEAQFEEQRTACLAENAEAVERLKDALGLAPMEAPYAYVKAVQQNFDGSRIQYSEEYYETLGLYGEEEAEVTSCCEADTDPCSD